MLLFFLSWYIIKLYRVVNQTRVCYASFECVGMCKYDDVNVLFYSFVLCMLFCSAADALVVAEGVRYNSSVHLILRRLCLPEVKKREKKSLKKNIVHVFFVPIYSDASLQELIHFII